MSYNGWTNRATWAVNLHLDAYIIDMAHEYVNDQQLDIIHGVYCLSDRQRNEFADVIEANFYEFINYENLPYVLRDLLSDSDIDWENLVDGHLDDALNEYNEQNLVQS
jgi:hypothetical protein